MEIIVHRVNAFTAGDNSGNPAGVVLNADNLSEDQMLKIATEVGFSETAFISESEVADKRLRFFTSMTEVDLCGHATIASWAFMYRREELEAGQYTQETNAGMLKVDVGDDGLVFMEQAKAGFYEYIDKVKIMNALGLAVEDFDQNLQPQVVSTGLRNLFVAVSTEQILNSMKVDIDVLKSLSREIKIAGVRVFYVSDDEGMAAAARNFAPLVGIDEESATGTANGAMLSYLIKNNAIANRQSYKVEQGKAMGNTSHIYGKLIDEKVWIGGRAELINEIKVNI